MHRWLTVVVVVVVVVIVVVLIGFFFVFITNKNNNNTDSINQAMETIASTKEKIHIKKIVFSEGNFILFDMPAAEGSADATEHYHF